MILLPPLIYAKLAMKQFWEHFQCENFFSRIIIVRILIIVVIVIMVGMLLAVLLAILLFMFFRQGFHCSKGCAVLPQRKDCSEGGGGDCVRDSITADDGRRRGAQPWPW